QQVCNSHYMIIVKNGYTEYKSASVPNSSTKLLFDDYHNIHENRCLNNTFLSEAAYLATSVCKKVERIDQLTIHTYDNAIVERKEERRMKDAILVGIQEQQLHSVQDYLKALNMILNYNKEIGCLTNNVAPI
ncbi:1545_t:CDS:2, partial [Dentiscutata erythropus]